MREPVRDPLRLQHILDAISKIKEYTEGQDRSSFESDTMRVHATAYNIQIIGEAVYKLSNEFKSEHPETPWRLIEKMRHILVHDYFAVDLDFVWSVVVQDLPVLEQRTSIYLKELNKNQ